VLRGALAQAVKWNMLVKNPAEMLDRKDRPKVERKPVAVMDAADAMKLLEAARGTRWFIPMLLGSMCGIRRGEICALRWRSVNFDTGQIAVSHSIEQTQKGCREKETKAASAAPLPCPLS
jgi:integrase